MQGIAALALGLASDAFAAALTVGADCGVCRKGEIRKAVTNPRILFAAVVFGAFQALMPLAGWLMSVWFAGVIEPVDHWIAFALLEYIAAKMLYDAIKDKGEECCGLSMPDIIILGVATSIDALAAGVSLNAMDTSPLTAVAGIGIVTFLLSYIGGLTGGLIKGMGCGRVSFAAKGAKLIGAAVLMLTGIHVLAEHLGW